MAFEKRQHMEFLVSARRAPSADSEDEDENLATVAACSSTRPSMSDGQPPVSGKPWPWDARRVRPVVKKRGYSLYPS